MEITQEQYAEIADSLEKEPEVRAQISTAVEPGSRLSFFAADLTEDAGWAAAVEGCDYVLHIAAPVGVDAPRDPNDLIIPTRDGTLRVLRASCGAKVQRVVMTSAIEACRPPLKSPDSSATKVFGRTRTIPSSDRIGLRRLWQSGQLGTSWRVKLDPPH